MMRCDHSQNLVARAWDDELTVAERDTLETHWSSCAPCRRAYDEYARTLELVQSLPRPTVSADFAARVLSEARRREAETKHASRLGRPGWAFGLAPRPAFALAAAFAVVLGVGAVARFAPRGGESQAPAVATAPEIAPSAPMAPVVEAPAPRIASAVPTPSDARTERVAGSEERVETPAPARIQPVSASSDAMALADAPAVPDSLFDHSADVELVLDPVRMRRERGRGYTPVQTTVRGEAASITF